MLLTLSPETLVALKEIFLVLAGGVCGAFGIFIVERLGKIHCAVENWQIKYLRESQNSMGGLQRKEVKDIIECNVCEYSMELDLFNSAGIPKALRDIYIEFKGKGFSISNKASDSNSRTYKHGSTQIQPLKYINLEPKKMVHLTLEGRLRSEEAKVIYQGASVFLKALDHKGKTFKSKLTKTNVLCST